MFKYKKKDGVNYKKDGLLMRFVMDDDSYHFFDVRGGKLTCINDDDLDYRSKKKLDKKNEKLRNDFGIVLEERTNSSTTKLLSKESKIEEWKNFLNTYGFPCQCGEHLDDNNYTISPELDNCLEQLLSEEKVLICMYSLNNPCILEDIFSNGVIADSNSIKYYSDNHTIKKELIYSPYGSILIRIPSEVIKKPDDLYIQNDGFTKINPKYIVGYVPVYPNNHLKNIIFNITYTPNQDDNIKNKQ